MIDAAYLGSPSFFASAIRNQEKPVNLLRDAYGDQDDSTIIAERVSKALRIQAILMARQLVAAYQAGLAASKVGRERISPYYDDEMADLHWFAGYDHQPMPDLEDLFPTGNIEAGLPSAADLDTVVEEQAIAEATA